MRWKLLSNWTKLLMIISSALIIFFLALAILLGEATDRYIIPVMIVYILLIIGGWLIGLLNAYLIINNKKLLANIISIIIPISIVGYFSWAFIWQMTNYPEQVGTLSQNAFFLLPLLVIVVYFIISLIFINKPKRK